MKLRNRVSTLIILIAICSIMISGCGGGGGGSSEPIDKTPSIRLNNYYSQLLPGNSIVITASMTNLNPTYTWWSATGGSIRQISNTQIVYTAGSSTGNYRITCGNYGDPEVRAYSNIRIVSSGTTY